MASVFLYHVVGDLTVGKPVVVEFYESETVESAIRAIGESTEGGLPVWRKRSHVGIENPEMMQQRFIGILNSLDIVAFLSRHECLEDQDKAMKTPVSEFIAHNNSLLRQVDPGTRLIDALEMMKHGVKRLLVTKNVGRQGVSKRFSILYNGKWLKNINTSSGSNNNLVANNRPSSSSTAVPSKFCCLSREDVIRFLIGCLGSLAPVPLSSIHSLGAINPKYYSVEAYVPATEVSKGLPRDPSAVAVIEPTPEGQYKIIGEISASRLWKCDYLAAAWALANLSSGQFVMGIEDNIVGRSLHDLSLNSTVGEKSIIEGYGGSAKPRKFSSRSIGFFSTTNASFGIGRSMYRGRSAPLTCNVTSSLAAVMAQMLSHRATHVWVIEDDSDDILVGVMGYADILGAVTKQPPPTAFVSPTPSYKEGLVVGADILN